MRIPAAAASPAAPETVYRGYAAVVLIRCDVKSFRPEERQAGNGGVGCRRHLENHLRNHLSLRALFVRRNISAAAVIEINCYWLIRLPGVAGVS